MKLTVDGSGMPTAADHGWAELFDEDGVWKACSNCLVNKVQTSEFFLFEVI